tara:strand:+ start:475 stop:630 length:156 start_codon:yes stop_codon:yes gene_type:complete
LHDFKKALKLGCIDRVVGKIADEEVLRDILNDQVDFGQGSVFRELNCLSAA